MPSKLKSDSKQQSSVNQKQQTEAAVNHSALIAAIRAGQLHIVEDLVRRRANINQRHALTGKTPLMVAACYGRTEIVEYLLGLDIDVEISHRQDLLGKNAMMWAAERGYLDIVKLLRDNDPAAKITAIKEGGMTVLEYAKQAKKPNPQLIQYLIREEAFDAQPKESIRASTKPAAPSPQTAPLPNSPAIKSARAKTATPPSQPFPAPWPSAATSQQTSAKHKPTFLLGQLEKLNNSISSSIAIYVNAIESIQRGTKKPMAKKRDSADINQTRILKLFDDAQIKLDNIYNSLKTFDELRQDLNKQLTNTLPLKYKQRELETSWFEQQKVYAQFKKELPVIKEDLLARLKAVKPSQNSLTSSAGASEPSPTAQSSHLFNFIPGVHSPIAIQRRNATRKNVSETPTAVRQLEAAVEDLEQRYKNIEKLEDPLAELSNIENAIYDLTPTEQLTQEVASAKEGSSVLEKQLDKCVGRLAKLAMMVYAAQERYSSETSTTPKADQKANSASDKATACTRDMLQVFHSQPTSSLSETIKDLDEAGITLKDNVEQFLAKELPPQWKQPQSKAVVLQEQAAWQKVKTQVDNLLKQANSLREKDEAYREPDASSANMKIILNAEARIMLFSLDLLALQSTAKKEIQQRETFLQSQQETTPLAQVSSDYRTRAYAPS